MDREYGVSNTRVKHIVIHEAHIRESPDRHVVSAREDREVFIEIFQINQLHVTHLHNGFTKCVLKVNMNL